MSLTAEQQRKVNLIKAALGASDHGIYDHFFSLDTFERSAQKAGSGRVSGQWIETLTKLRAEILRARDRLDGLHTGLRAETQLRKALIQSAAGVAAWKFALESKDPQEINAALLRMKTHFNVAESYGRSGAGYLKRGK